MGHKTESAANAESGACIRQRKTPVSRTKVRFPR